MLIKNYEIMEMVKDNIDARFYEDAYEDAESDCCTDEDESIFEGSEEYEVEVLQYKVHDDMSGRLTIIGTVRVSASVEYGHYYCDDWKDGDLYKETEGIGFGEVHVAFHLITDNEGTVFEKEYKAA